MERDLSSLVPVQPEKRKGDRNLTPEERSAQFRERRIEKHNAWVAECELARKQAIKRNRAPVRLLRETFVKDVACFDGEIFPAYAEVGEWTRQTQVFFDAPTFKRIKALIRAYQIAFMWSKPSRRRINGKTLYSGTVYEWVETKPSKS